MIHKITRHSRHDCLPRHRHEKSYAAVVLAGGYIEAGDDGRTLVAAGDAVFHGPYRSHRNEFGGSGAIVLNVPLPSAVAPGTRRVADVDAVARCAERDPIEAAAMLLENSIIIIADRDDWPDRLARRLTADPDLCLRDYAERIGIAPQSLSRGFRQVYGTTPKRFRAEQRALRAIDRLRDDDSRLADLAAELGFADQAHLARAVTHLTGCPPARFRVQSMQEQIGSAGYSDMILA